VIQSESPAPTLTCDDAGEPDETPSQRVTGRDGKSYPKASSRKTEKLQPDPIKDAIMAEAEKAQAPQVLACHFGVSEKHIRTVIPVMLDHVVPAGFWVEAKPYRVVTRTPYETFSTKIGYLLKDLRSLERTAKSLNLTRNPSAVQSLAISVKGAAMMVQGMKSTVENCLQEELDTEQKKLEIQRLKAEIEEANRELAELG
jgi:hypothetical protein